ncbi:hypothetical protein QO016_001297 [Methylobacterium persicinum]|uniref:Uncharacterized protein n=1 Tax=Methylobacterium persicinum TaxID=374426 RepID=A0ABU0HHK7_9HYPH|nr:hypothetical protein [Methylobacterium persicinum]
MTGLSGRGPDVAGGGTLSFRATLGAIIALKTVVVPQVGQLTKPRAICVS